MRWRVSNDEFLGEMERKNVTYTYNQKEAFEIFSQNNEECGLWDCDINGN